MQYFDRNRPYKEEIEWGPQTRQPCWALWQTMYLNEEGRMISCGAMAKTLGLKENIFEMSAYDLWRCESMEKLKGNRWSLGIVRNLTVGQVQW